MSRVTCVIVAAIFMLSTGALVGCDEEEEVEQDDQAQQQADQSDELDDEGRVVDGDDDDPAGTESDLERVARLMAEHARHESELERKIGRIECECSPLEAMMPPWEEPEEDVEDFTSDDVDECLDEVVPDASVPDEIGDCMEEEIVASGESPPATVIEVAECLEEGVVEAHECVEEAEQQAGDSCSEEAEEARQQCRDTAREASGECHDLIDEDVEQWEQTVGDETGVRDCDRIGQQEVPPVEVEDQAVEEPPQ